MPLGNNITNVLKGSTQIDRILKGTQVVWENFKPITNITKRSFASSSAAQTSYTFNSQSIGAASSERWVVALVTCFTQTGTGSLVLNSLTIGGVSTAFEQHRADATNRWHVAIAYAKVPSGTTANIVINYDRKAEACACQLATFNAADSLSTVDVVKRSSSSTAGKTITLSDVECAEGGIVLSVGTAGANAGSTFNWNGVDNAVGLQNDSYDGTAVRHYSAYVATTESSTVRDFTFTLSPNGVAFGMASMAVSLVPD